MKNKTVQYQQVCKRKLYQRVSQKKSLLLLVLIFLLTVMSACGNSLQTKSTSADIGYAEAAAEAPMMDNFSGTSAGGTNSVEFSKDAKQDDGGQPAAQPPSAPEELGRKIIKDGSAEIETTEFDKSLNNLYEMLIKNGGFVESQNLQGSRVNDSSLRYATIIIRVPSKVFDETMYNLSSLGTVFNQRTQGTDITDQYTDTESRVRNLKVQEDRILELITKADKIEEIVTLEGRLSDLRYQIESFENSLKNFDRLLDYSRISLNINEVVKVTYQQPVPKTLSERLSQAFDSAWIDFVDGAENLTVWFVYNIFTLIILLLIFIIVIIIIGSSKKRGRKKQQKQIEKQNAMGVQPNYQPVNQMLNQTNNQPVNQGGNQPMNQPNNLPTGQLYNQSVDHIGNQPTNQSIDPLPEHKDNTQETKPTDEK